MRSAASPGGAEFVNDIARWAMWVAPALALIGAFVTRDGSWAVACLVGAGYDIVTLTAAAGTVPGEGSWALSQKFGIVMLARMLGKAVLIVASIALPDLLNAWGMMFGVLTTEITMMTVGAVVAALRTFGHGKTAA